MSITLLWLTFIASTVAALGQIFVLTADWRQRRWEEKYARKRAKRDAEWEAYRERHRP